jgi:hypothetical protein
MPLGSSASSLALQKTITHNIDISRAFEMIPKAFESIRDNTIKKKPIEIHEPKITKTIDSKEKKNPHKDFYTADRTNQTAN